MTKREFATMLFRLLALYFVGVSLHYLPFVFHEWENYRNGFGPMGTPSTLRSVMLAGLPFLLFSGFGLVLFLFASSLADIPTNRDGEPLHINAGLMELRAAVLMGAGAVTVANTLPALFSSLAYYNSLDATVQNAPLEERFPVAQIIKLLFGFFLLRCGGWRFPHPTDWGREESSPPEKALDDTIV